MTKVVGFDLDDTLVAEVLFIRSGIYFIARLLHDQFPVIPYYRIICGMETAVQTKQNHYSALERLLKEYRIDGLVDMSATVAGFRSHCPDPSIYHAAPSVIQILSELRQDPDIKTVLITDGRSLTQRNKIKAAGLDVFFDKENIFISEETGYDKTYPYTFLRVMERYTGAKEFHYVGDNPLKDFLHPSGLGWHTHQVHEFPLMVHQGIPK